MLNIIGRYLSSQDPDKKHNLLTRLLVSLLILIAFVVLYGFYGLIGSVLAYLVGVELIGLSRGWALLPLAIGCAIGAGHAIRSMRDYWQNFGHGR